MLNNNTIVTKRCQPTSRQQRRRLEDLDPKKSSDQSPLADAHRRLGDSSASSSPSLLLSRCSNDDANGESPIFQKLWRARISTSCATRRARAHRRASMSGRVERPSQHASARLHSLARAPARLLMRATTTTSGGGVDDNDDDEPSKSEEAGADFDRRRRCRTLRAPSLAVVVAHRPPPLERPLRDAHQPRHRAAGARDRHVDSRSRCLHDGSWMAVLKIGSSLMQS